MVANNASVGMARNFGASTIGDGNLKTELTGDHARIEDTVAVRRYFAKFDRIIGHTKDVAATMPRRGRLAAAELQIIEDYLAALAKSFSALSMKHLFAGRDTGARVEALEIDKRDSGFPVYGELLHLANDAVQVEDRLRSMPGQKSLKENMASHILNEGSPPTRLQFAMSQRLYFEALAMGGLFWPHNHPKAVWIGDHNERRRYLIHWAVYDSQMNVPTLYLMIVEDTGRRPLMQDERRWPAMQEHLMAQSVGSLKMVTIGQGFDVDFDDLHPKFMRRIHIGPMYSHAFTQQSGPLRDILAEASGVPGLDWALTWTIETLHSAKNRTEEKGWFGGTVEREVFKLDKDPISGDIPGETHVEHSLILPERAYQVLRHKDPPTLRGVKKYVVGEGGRVLAGM